MEPENKADLAQKHDEIKIVAAENEAESNSGRNSKRHEAEFPTAVTEQNSKIAKSTAILSGLTDSSKITPRRNLTQKYIVCWVAFVFASIALTAAHAGLGFLTSAGAVFIGYFSIPVVVFLPALIAGYRKSSKSNLVALLSIFLGCTVIGWIAGLWIAIKSAPGTKHKLSAAYRNSAIGLAILSAISLCGSLMNQPQLQWIGLLALLFEPVQALLAGLLQERLKEENPAASYLGTVTAWLAGNVSSVTISGVMLGVVAEILNIIYAIAQATHAPQTQLIGAIFLSMWLVTTVLLILALNIGVYFYRLSKDVADSAKQKSRGVQYRALLTGLGPAIAVLWISLNTGGSHGHGPLTVAVPIGLLWSMTFMYFTVRDWEQNCESSVKEAKAMSIDSSP